MPRIRKREGLEKAFAKAGLTLQLLKKPIRNGRGMESIVQLDVGRKVNGTRRYEWFRLYPGYGATIQVRDTDAKRKQLVLLVREVEQEFEETIDPSWVKRASRRHKDWLQRFLRENGLQRSDLARVQPKDGVLIVKRKTPADIRYFLMGVDERQLFIAQLTRSATTVEGARKLLGNTVQFAEGKRRGSSIDRQGEWFFLETTREQREAIDKLIRKNVIQVRNKVAIGAFMNRGGNPHRADELVHFQDTEGRLAARHPEMLNFPVRERKVFIKGKVTHQDHKTVHFHQWREVVANNEGATARAAGSSGVFWVD